MAQIQPKTREGGERGHLSKGQVCLAVGTLCLKLPWPPKGKPLTEWDPGLRSKVRLGEGKSGQRRKTNGCVLVLSLLICCNLGQVT